MSARLIESYYPSHDVMEPPAMSLGDFIKVLQRRRGLIFATIGALFVVSLLIAFLLPPVYRSSATILIQEQEIPQDLVRSTVTSYADERIQVISQQVMTRAVLLELVDRYGLYANKRRYSTNEEILDRMREDIKLTPVSADITDRRSGSQVKATIAFKLSFDSNSADSAQKVTNELATLFLKGNLKNRQQMAAEASSFLSEEANRLSAHIAEVEGKLSDFKRRNQGRLPELAGLNMQMSDRTDSELMRVERDLIALRDRKIYLDAQLSQLKPTNPIISSGGERVILDPEARLKSLESQLASASGVYSDDHPDIKRLRREIESLKNSTGTAPGAADQRDRLAVMQGRLAELKMKYSDDHPDVIKAKRAIASLQQSGAAAAKPNQEPDNPPYIAIKAELESVGAEMRSLQGLRDSLRGKLSMLEGRMQQTPQVEREYLEMSRDQENSMIRFRELKAKQMQAEVAETLERDSKAERFSLIEPPQFPERPFSPNRMAIVMMGLVISGIGGLSAAGLREATDKSVRDARDVMRILHVPVLAVIPLIARADAARRDKTRLRLILAAVVGCVVVGLLLVQFFVMPLEVAWFSMLRKLSL